MKIKNYFFQKPYLFLVGLLISFSVNAADITTGLKLYYTFDALTDGSIAVNDDSGNGNNGTLNGAMMNPIAGYNSFGVQGLVKADYIKLPADITTPLTDFTYAAWVNFSTLKNAIRFFDFGNGADATNNFLAFIPSYNGDNQFMTLRFRPASGTAYNVTTTTKLPTNAWAHVALTSTWDGVNSTVKIYLNGAQVGTGTMPFNLSMLGTTADNYFCYSRWAQDVNGFNGTIDEIRLYNRALTADDVLYLSGLAELNTQYSNLTANTLKADGNLLAVTSNLNLPTTLGTKGVSVKWASTNNAVADTFGVVTPPAKYNAPVKFTATLSHIVNGKTYTMTKDFYVMVMGTIPTPDEIAQWDFNSAAISTIGGVIAVTDNKSGFVGTLKNDARIRTIGNIGSDQFNVLDLGNGTGYFDMGTEIGKAVYSLMDYTVCGYFRIDDAYAYLNSNGNFYWTFSNSADIDADKNGYMIGSLKAQSQSVATNYYNIGNQAAGVNTNAPKGAWHHFAYVQQGNIGTVYVDGTQMAQNTALTNLPGFAIPKAGLEGTSYNWLGRSNYKNDVYLRQSLLYDFRLYAVPLSASDISLDVVEVAATLDKLNNAYAQNPDYIDNSLATERDNLSLGDLSAVTSNLTLPTIGTLDPTITISWKTSNSNLISTDGTVIRPNYYNYVDTLTATLAKNGQTTTKKFYATVILKDGTAFQNNLLVKYDFSQVSSDSIVTDVAEKHFQGIAKKNATIVTIGTTIPYKVLSLGDSIGYFDMGTEVGKLMYNLQDYTISAYYRVDTAYNELNSTTNGNFLWSFSNSPNILSQATGYMFGGLKTQGVILTSTNWSAEQAVKMDAVALKGSWHNMTYTQSGTTGTIYLDGMPIATGEITKLLSSTLSREGMLGTPYNWLGRSCYNGDAYLRKTLVYDFRLYNIALNEAQIQATELNVGNTINALDMAYSEGFTSVPSIKTSFYKIATSKGSIRIIGLKGNENVTLTDISGRKIKVNDKSNIEVGSGIYIIKIDNFADKVFVK